MKLENTILKKSSLFFCTSLVCNPMYFFIQDFITLITKNRLQTFYDNILTIIYSWIKKVPLVVGHLSIWNNAMINLNDHQTIASQCPIPKAQSNLYWISYFLFRVIFVFLLFLVMVMHANICMYVSTLFKEAQTLNGKLTNLRPSKTKEKLKLQGRNKVYGIRDQQQKVGWDQGSQRLDLRSQAVD